MNTMLTASSLKKRIDAIEWRLLLFLILFLNVKLAIKLVALIIIYIVNPDFKFGFKIKNSRLPLFYLIIIGIALVNWIIYRYFSLNYTIALFTGIFFWIMCILSIHQVKSLVERTGINKLHNTLFVFFIINIVFSFFNLFAIFFEIGFQNPFLYQGLYQKYFVNTGDYIKGISFDTSTANALINAFAVIYFMYRKKYMMVIASMIILLLTASNLTNFILVAVLIYMFLFRSDKEQKSIMIICILSLIIFLVKFSPQNNRYVDEFFNKYLSHVSENPVTTKPIRITDRPDSILNAEEKREKIAQLYMDSLDRVQLAKIEMAKNETTDFSTTNFLERPFIETASIHSAPFQRKNDTTELQLRLISYINDHSKNFYGFVQGYDETLPGKAIAFYQLFDFFRTHPQKILTGTGAGNFSSKLAFRTMGLKIAGGYPEKFSYINNDFSMNHFAVYSYFFTKPASAHSITNTPNSVYGQLLSEYGLIGIVAFLFYYVGFFIKKHKRTSFALPVFFILLSAFFVEYWFEQLSIVLLFELMIFIDIKQHEKDLVNE